MTYGDGGGGGGQQSRPETIQTLNHSCNFSFLLSPDTYPSLQPVALNGVTSPYPSLCCALLCAMGKQWVFVGLRETEMWRWKEYRMSLSRAFWSMCACLASWLAGKVTQLHVQRPGVLLCRCVCDVVRLHASIVSVVAVVVWIRCESVCVGGGGSCKQD